jgi:prepilin-type N-terminal cleavage/methylation domain-containing protein
MKRTGPQRQRGVSLIEALVAMAVMAIGMLGLVGVQSTLRSNSDVSKQRSEAVRLAQQEVEKWRAFVTLDAGAGGTPNGYADLAVGTTSETITGGNASFTRQRTVTALAAPRSGKSLLVDVSWSDRTGQTQSVRLATLIAGISPTLASTLTVPGEGDTVRRPQGRSRGIPPLAKDLGNGTSGLKPPGAAGDVAWIFNNGTGLIEVCTTSAATTNDINTDSTSANFNTTCGGSQAMLVSGFVRYALSTTQPGVYDALRPSSQPDSSIEVWANRTAPNSLQVQCSVQHVSLPSAYSAFYCAVPVTVIPNVPPTWSGNLYFKPTSKFAAALANRSSSLYKACRYAATPAAYSLVSTARQNENFLIILAGHDGDTYSCPEPTTLAFQPAS